MLVGDKVLSELWKGISQLGFVESVKRVQQHSDYPPFYHFQAKLQVDPEETDGDVNTTRSASGFSFFNEKLALLKCFGEAVERYSCMVYRQKEFEYSSYNILHDRGAVDPDDFFAYSFKQLEKEQFAHMRVNKDTKMDWVCGRKLGNESVWMLPAHLVYFSYRFKKNTNVRLYPPISTGAAGGINLEDALYRGILEIIERDAFMCAYLQKLGKGKIKLRLIPDRRVKFFLDLIRRYKLELCVVDITNDLGIPSYIALLIDKTGYGPAVTTGMKADYNSVNAVVGAIEESFLPRNWLRMAYEDMMIKGSTFEEIVPREIIRPIDRGYYWYPQERIQDLDFWLEQDEVDFISGKTSNNVYGCIVGLNRLKSTLERSGKNIYYVNLTPPIFQGRYSVVKTLIPELHPLYLDERVPCWGGELTIANTIPHPFL